MLTLMPGNVPNIMSSLSDDMIRSSSTMFAIQLQSQARGSICGARVIKWISEIINKHELRTYKIKCSSQSYRPLSTLHPSEV